MKDNFVSKILSEKERLISNLKSFCYVTKIYPSDSNFILVKMINAQSVFDHLNINGIRVRMRKDEERLKDCLRITVGTRLENDFLIKILKDIK
jgi:histidinol-phosphate aminotransferase